MVIYDPGVLLLGIHPREVLSMSMRGKSEGCSSQNHLWWKREVR